MVPQIHCLTGGLECHTFTKYGCVNGKKMHFNLIYINPFVVISLKLFIKLLCDLFFFFLSGISLALNKMSLL